MRKEHVYLNSPYIYVYMYVYLKTFIYFIAEHLLNVEEFDMESIAHRE